MQLPTPEFHSSQEWVARYLGDLACDEVTRSSRFTGGQRAADGALLSFDVAGYAGRRDHVFPVERRGASGLSPYIRHGLLPLPRVWQAVEGGPLRDVRKFRDELLWQEYARHLYARVGHALSDWIRQGVRVEPTWAREPWPRDMACIDRVVAELLEDGWLVNQSRMWMASQWTVRAGADWRGGEDAFFRHLLDGSRAANRAGWQWTIGAITGKAYGFSRRQVELRAPGICGGCPLSDRCPIEEWPAPPILFRVDEPQGLRHDPDPPRTSGPSQPELLGKPTAVWLTAESLGDNDPALRAHPDLPAVFVFDRPLLARLRLSSKRLVFLAETLADLAVRRPVVVRLGEVAEELAGSHAAVTFAPVPGFRRLRRRIDVAELHPWPWLRRPGGGSVASFSQWRRSVQD